MDKDNPLHLSWCKRIFPPLNQHNVLQYFSDKSNPFYDYTCNNEQLKMRNLHLRELEKMKGIEYTLLEFKEPILYIIRKQHRHSPTYVVPIANYYIIAGVVYQAPDLKSIIESKLLTTIHSLQSAFEECFEYVRFHPSIDYTWTFDRNGDGNNNDNKDKNKDDKNNDDNNSDNKKNSSTSSTTNASNKMNKESFIIDGSNQMRLRYRESVDKLLLNLLQKFPPNQTAAVNTNNSNNNNDQQKPIIAANNQQSQQTQNGVTTNEATKPTTTTSTANVSIKIEDDNHSQQQNHSNILMDQRLKQQQQQQQSVGQKSSSQSSSTSMMMLKKPKLN